MKAPGQTVTLRSVSWEGEFPVPGDLLRTKTGRTYEVEKVRGNNLICVVLPKGLPTDGSRVHEWWWLSRRKKQARKGQAK